MMTNIEYATIDKNKVLLSNFIVPLAAPIFVFCLPILDGSFGSEPIGNIIGFFFLALIFGALFWVPTIIFTLIVELFSINERTTDHHLALILLVEGVVAFVIILLIFGGAKINGHAAIALFFSISIPQLLRWWYLKYKGRMYRKAPSTQVFDHLN